MRQIVGLQYLVIFRAKEGDVPMIYSEHKKHEDARADAQFLNTNSPGAIVRIETRSVWSDEQKQPTQEPKATRRIAREEEAVA